RTASLGGARSVVLRRLVGANAARARRRLDPREGRWRRLGVDLVTLVHQVDGRVAGKGRACRRQEGRNQGQQRSVRGDVLQERQRRLLGGLGRGGEVQERR